MCVCVCVVMREPDFGEKRDANEGIVEIKCKYLGPI